MDAPAKAAEVRIYLRRAALKRAVLNNSLGRLIFCHQDDIPWIAEFTRQLSNSSAGDAYEVDFFKLGPADMPGI